MIVYNKNKLFKRAEYREVTNRMGTYAFVPSSIAEYLDRSKFDSKYRPHNGQICKVIYFGYDESCEGYFYILETSDAEKQFVIVAHGVSLRPFKQKG